MACAPSCSPCARCTGIPCKIPHDLCQPVCQFMAAMALCTCSAGFRRRLPMYPFPLYYGEAPCRHACAAQAAVKAVNEARQNARTASGNLPPTPVMPGDQAAGSAAPAPTASTQAPAQSTSLGSGGPGGAVSGAAPSSGTVDADSNAKDSKAAAGAPLNCLLHPVTRLTYRWQLALLLHLRTVWEL